MILYEDNAALSHKLEETMSKVIEPSTLHQNSFIHISLRIAAILMLSRYDHVIIWHMVHNIGMR